MASTRNPEDDVCDAIAELVEESLAHGPTCDYDRAYLERCALCDYEWHGLVGDGEVGVLGCPGAYATDEQTKKWQSWWNRPEQTKIHSSARGARGLDHADIGFAAQDRSGFTQADVEAMRGGFVSPGHFRYELAEPVLPGDDRIIFVTTTTIGNVVGQMLGLSEEVMTTISEIVERLRSFGEEMQQCHMVWYLLDNPDVDQSSYEPGHDL